MKFSGNKELISLFRRSEICYPRAVGLALSVGSEGSWESRFSGSFLLLLVTLSAPGPGDASLRSPLPSFSLPLLSPFTSYKKKMHYSFRTHPQLEWSLLFHKRSLFQTKPWSQHPVRHIFGDHHFDPAYLAHVTSICTQISQIFSANTPCIHTHTVLPC